MIIHRELKLILVLYGFFNDIDKSTLKPYNCNIFFYQAPSFSNQYFCASLFGFFALLDVSKLYRHPDLQFLFHAFFFFSYLTKLKTEWFLKRV